MGDSVRSDLFTWDICIRDCLDQNLGLEVRRLVGDRDTCILLREPFPCFPFQAKKNKRIEWVIAVLGQRKSAQRETRDLVCDGDGSLESTCMGGSDRLLFIDDDLTVGFQLRAFTLLD